jgi:hypothetical protein
MPFTPRGTLGLTLAALALVLGLGGGWVANRLIAGRAGGRTVVNQSMVVDRLESVAKLITTEAMVRDVVTYRNTWLGSTKRSLVIATGKVLVGLDLSTTPEIQIDPAAHRISMHLPAARLLAIDVVDLKTYDEQRGLWNPFHPADRDTIFLLARHQLARAAADLSVVEHAEASARDLLQRMFAEHGYAVEVTFEPPPGS